MGRPQIKFLIIYSKKPILNAFSGGGDIVQIAKCGITVEAQNPQAITDGILKLYNMDNEERERLGISGKRYVLEHFTYEKLAKKFKELL